MRAFSGVHVIAIIGLLALLAVAFLMLSPWSVTMGFGSGIVTSRSSDPGTGRVIEAQQFIESGVASDMVVRHLRRQPESLNACVSRYPGMYTILQVVIEQDRLELVELLVAAGADPLKRCRKVAVVWYSGETPPEPTMDELGPNHLEFAIEKGRSAALDRMLAHLVDVLEPEVFAELVGDLRGFLDGHGPEGADEREQIASVLGAFGSSE